MAVKAVSVSPRRTPSKKAVYVDMSMSSDEERAPVKAASSSKSKRYADPDEEDAIIGTEEELVEDSPAEEGQSGEESEPEYEVDYIVDSKLVDYDGTPALEFLLHWKGYAVADRTWETATQFKQSDPVVKKFYAANPFKPNWKSAEAKNKKRKSLSNEVRNETPKKAAPKKSTPKKAGPKKAEEIIYRDSEDDGEEEESEEQPKKKRVLQPTKSTTVSASKPRASVGKTSTKRKREASEDDDYVDEPKAESDAEIGDESDGGASGDDEGDAAEAASEVDSEVEQPVKGKQAQKKAPKAKPKPKKVVNLRSFKSGVIPLPDAPDGSSATAKKGGLYHLPPINDLDTMFTDMTSRMPDLVKVVKRLNGRSLRVATMCSGTESPILALGMITKALKAQHGETLSIDHVFSCEIEPFKQAYIERNFAPPILFRDVTELGKKRAHTAYGSLTEVPGDVDMLIAGTSCVDYSGLNNKQQDIDANGESGRTFRGMLQWVKKHQPPIVILENVCNAPWDKVVDYFAEIDYDAQHVRFDTKEFYIPHTRTRVYLLATPRNKEAITARWEQTVKDLRRPWSSTFEAFLLPSDDHKIHLARLEIAAEKLKQDGPARKATDWGRCESRHHRARLEEELGYLRPLTAWQEAGVCRLLDWAWAEWGGNQTERVLDLLDIIYLRLAKDGVDSNYKASVLNVSQNVDRQTGSGKTGLAPCLTPNMIPFITTRGGPATGREALALQGIPVRELLLTSESEDQLADLAGNAMSSTVVGAAMLAALMVCVDELTPGESADEDAARLTEIETNEDRAIANRIVGEEQLESQILDLAKATPAPLRDILDLAERSSRHCQCEAQVGTAVAPIEQCEACGYRACKKCSGRPEHCYAAQSTERVDPAAFERRLKDMLPMRVQVAGLSGEQLEHLRAAAANEGKGQVDDKQWATWSEAVMKGIENGAEFRFRRMKRQNTWMASYEAPHAFLDLFLDHRHPEWHLTIKAPDSAAVKSEIRAMLAHPVARLQCDIEGSDFLSGNWELCIPTQNSIQLTITGKGEVIPSWQADLGLTGALAQTKRWSKLEISLKDDDRKLLDRDISGLYELLPKCGMAMGSLHKRVDHSDDQQHAQLYFFLDPTREGEPEEDPFVFSTNIDRTDYGVERAIAGFVDPAWRPTSDPVKQICLNVRGGWVLCPSTKLVAVGGGDLAVTSMQGPATADSALFSIPKKSLVVKLDAESCSHAQALLTCDVPLDPAHCESMWREGAWGEVDLQHHSYASFEKLAWITERLPPLEAVTDWTPMGTLEGTKINDTTSTPCARCAPAQPVVHWIRRAGKTNKAGHKMKATVVAFEDKQQASRYEQALKQRPAPFVVQLRLNDDARGALRVGLNMSSLAHRALSRLPPRFDGNTTANLSWRLTTNRVAEGLRTARVFSLSSNKNDPEHPQPTKLHLNLRKEQRRSLHWMLQQEAAEGRSHTFVEEEISEAVLPALGWRAEGKAERHIMVRGGVIADEVGYGKTIISIGLIAESKDLPAPSMPEDGLINIKATLIVVPGHLTRQWPSEIERFTGKLFRTLVIANVGALNKLSISDFQKADVIVCASDLLKSEAYLKRLEYLAAQPADWLHDSGGGRFFRNRLTSALDTLREQAGRLQGDGGAKAALEAIKEAHRKSVDEVNAQKEHIKTANFGKRTKGQAYRDKYDGKPAKKKAKVSEKAEDWVASEDEGESELEDEDRLEIPKLNSYKGAGQLTDPAVQKNYKLLGSPPLQLFRFRRVITDEYTYLETHELAGVLSLQAAYKWVLSGTPPVQDFNSIKTISAFLGIHLGIDDGTEVSPGQTLKQRQGELTKAEQFHAFREVHSPAWHSRRDDLAQQFLDTFVRQNLAEIDEIPTVEHIHRVQLPAAERAVYLELEHHLQALEMQAKKEKKFKDVSQNDRSQRLDQALLDSKTAEEALLKRCCHFTLDLSDRKRDAKNALEACNHITSAREEQLAACERHLKQEVQTALTLQELIRKKFPFEKDEAQPFASWVEHSFSEGPHGDMDAGDKLQSILREMNFDQFVIPRGGKISTDKGSAQEVKFALREKTHLLRKLFKELVARMRSLRFFDVVRRLQQGGDEAVAVLAQSSCGHAPEDNVQLPMGLFSCCGHVGCLVCIKKAADSQQCVDPVKCQAAVRATNVVTVESLGVEGQLSSGKFGAKLAKLVKIVKSIPEDDRILVFLQWPDLMDKLEEALTAAKVDVITLQGTATKKANALESFQQATNESRVLLLAVHDASAAGSNLTTANHAIFVGPLLVPSLFKFRSIETQAVGRVRRYGQSKEVHIHRLLTADTLDETVHADRRRELLEATDWRSFPQTEWK